MAADSTQELKKELNRQGIEPPTDAILAEEFPDATPEMVRTALANVSPNVGGGMRVIVLRERLSLSVARRIGVEKLRSLLESLEPELVKRYGENVKAILAAFGWLDAPGRNELHGNVRREIGRRLPDRLAAKIGIPDMDKAIEAWWRSSDQAHHAYIALGFDVLQESRPAPDTSASKPETLFSE